MTVKFENIKMSMFGAKCGKIVVVGEINTITVVRMSPEEAMLELIKKNHDDYPVEMILD